MSLPIDPEAVWAALPPALRRRVAEDLAAVLAKETPDEVRTRHARASGAPRGLASAEVVEIHAVLAVEGEVAIEV